MSAEETPSGRRGRPRCEESHARILAAAAALLETTPWAQLTIEAIAAEAQVGKQTIYKWWGGKPALVMDAYLSNVRANVRLPDTGSVEQDLVVYLKRSSNHLRETWAGRALASLIAEAQGDPKLERDLRERLIALRREALRSLILRGIERGELRADLDVEVLMDLFFGAFWYRLLLRTDPLNDRFAEQVVALVLPAITAPSAEREA